MVDFALVVPLMLVLVLAVAQLILIWHVKLVMTSAAQDGARSAANSGADWVEVEAIVLKRLAGSLAQGLVSDVEIGYKNDGAVGVVRVGVQGRLPLLGLLGLPGPSGLQVAGYSVVEHW